MTWLGKISASSNGLRRQCCDRRLRSSHTKRPLPVVRVVLDLEAAGIAEISSGLHGTPSF